MKTRLMDHLQRFIGDLVTRSSQISELLIDLQPIESALPPLWLLRDDLAVFPYIDRRAMHTSRLPRILRRESQGTAHTSRETPGLLGSSRRSHGACSSSRGV